MIKYLVKGAVYDKPDTSASTLISLSKSGAASTGSDVKISFNLPNASSCLLPQFYFSCFRTNLCISLAISAKSFTNLL